MTFLALIGVTFGCLLGKSRFRAWFVSLYALLLTVIFVPWQLCLTMPAKIPWLERLTSVGGRLSATYGQFIGGIPVEDSILFLTAMLLVFWLFTLVAGFQLVRTGRPWFGVALGCIAVLVIEYYDLPRTAHGLSSSLFAILLILLVSRLHYLNLRKRWESNGIPVDTETSLDWMRAAVVSALILVILAWNIPTWYRALSPNTPERRQMVQSWLALRDRLSNAVAPLTGTGPSEGDYYQSDISLGTTISTSSEIVFNVSSSEPRPGGVRYYWRARTYDEYRNGQWYSSYTSREEITPIDEVLPIPGWEQRFDSTFTFTLQTPLLRNFFTPGLPLIISRPAQAVGIQATRNYLDTSTLLAVPPLRAGELYRVKSSISAPTVNALETSTGEYPDWVQKYYLELPSNFPEEIRALAEEITAGLETPFEKTEAITKYLRQNITYKTSVQSSPSYIDPIEYMLFTTKEGFCHYYASAEVLMLRSIGIPARLAVGFAEGEMDDRRTNFTVRRKDAHAWPEVFFNEFGWVEFEPTAVQTALVRRKISSQDLAGGALRQDQLQAMDEGETRDLLGEQRAEELLNSEEEETAYDLPANRLYILWIAMLVLMLPLALGLFLWMRVSKGKITFPPLAVVIENNLVQRGFTAPAWVHERARLARLSPLERAFTAVPRALRLLGNPVERSLTPAEQVKQLAATLPEGNTPAQVLLEELHRGMYSPIPADLELAKKNGRRLTLLAWRSWLRRLLNKEFIEEHPSGL